MNRKKSTMGEKMIPARIREIVAEAELICGRHNGIHLLHNDYATIRIFQSLLDTGRPILIEIVDATIVRMRIADRTGVYPTADAIGRRDARAEKSLES